jgi:hypothetical protein
MVLVTCTVMPHGGVLVPTNVYVDGFNLYYGCLRGTPHKWLDLDALCRRLFPRDRINRIRYFTAIVSARPGDPQQPRRQQAYLRASPSEPTLMAGISFERYPSVLTARRWLRRTAGECRRQREDARSSWITSPPYSGSFLSIASTQYSMTPLRSCGRGQGSHRRGQGLDG